MEKATRAVAEIRGQLEHRQEQPEFTEALNFGMDRWAHIGRVLHRLEVARSQRRLTQTEQDALSVIALKVLKLRRTPQERLSAASIAQTIKRDKKSVRGALGRLAGFQLVRLDKNELGEVVRCELHPHIYRDGAEWQPGDSLCKTWG